VAVFDAAVLGVERANAVVAHEVECHGNDARSALASDDGAHDSAMHDSSQQAATSSSTEKETGNLRRTRRHR